MDEKQYEALLDKAYNELPEVLHGGRKRFVIPDVSGRIIKTRTQISNFGEIAKYVSREQSHMYRYLLKYVGVRGELNEEKGQVVLYSRFQPALINKAIRGYFDEFVVCSHCGSPDTVLETSTHKKCNACGHQEKVRVV